MLLKAFLDLSRKCLESLNPPAPSPGCDRGADALLAAATTGEALAAPNDVHVLRPNKQQQQHCR